MNCSNNLNCKVNYFWFQFFVSVDLINVFLFPVSFQVQTVSDHSNQISLNYKQKTSIVFGQRPFESDENVADFIYHLSFEARQTELTNDDNYAKLVQNILNTLSLWFGICILDLFICLNKLLNLIKKFHLLLIQFKNHLNSLKN